MGFINVESFYWFWKITVYQDKLKGVLGEHTCARLCNYSEANSQKP